MCSAQSAVCLCEDGVNIGVVLLSNVNRRYRSDSLLAVATQLLMAYNAVAKKEASLTQILKSTVIFSQSENDDSLVGIAPFFSERRKYSLGNQMRRWWVL